MKLPPNIAARTFLLLLILTTFLFITLHLSQGLTGWPEDANFSIAKDWGYGEFFQYIQELWIVGLLFFLALIRKKTPLFLWSLIYLFILADDSLTIHERVSRHLVYQKFVPSIFGLSPKALAEVLVIGGIVLIVFILVVVASRLSVGALRPINLNLVRLLIALAICAVGLDFLHSIVEIPVIWEIIGLLEDGGEMLVISLTAGYVFGLVIEKSE